jgi:predicted dehydrogenase
MNAARFRCGEIRRASGTDHRGCGDPRVGPYPSPRPTLHGYRIAARRKAYLDREALAGWPRPKIEAAVKGQRRHGGLSEPTNPPFVSAKKSVEAGEIGTPADGYIRLSNTTWVPMEMIPWGSKTSSLWFLAIHTIDVMRWLLQDEIMRVYAVSRSGILRSLGVDTQDFHCAIGEFKNGAVVTFENVWILPRSQPMVYDFKMELLGSKGQINVNTSHHAAVEKHIEGKMAYGDVFGTIPTAPRRLGGFVKEAIAQFVDAVVYDAPVLATLEDGMAGVRVADAILRSEASGQPVEL